ncbi:hypothetical protein [Streptomyces malaysiensis]|uniref:hypothetical protein n=1 Tax=Streptomyces malaysiensis TaxID=92644 RepID=UPI0033C55A15
MIELVTALVTLVGAIIALATVVVQARAAEVSRGDGERRSIETAGTGEREDGPDPNV